MNIEITQRLLIANKKRINECKNIASKIELCKTIIRDANIEEIENEDLPEVATMFEFSEYEKLASINKILDGYLGNKEVIVFSSKTDKKANIEVNKIVGMVIGIIGEDENS